VTDIVSPEKRSDMMSGIRGKNTKPEITVRRLLHRLGYRFRLHRKDLAGRPDIVLPKWRSVIFVNGC
jgi:DNA mismatch endonuclease (patch repair protein)